MSSLFGILCLLSALAATSYSYSCSRCSSIMSQCSVNNIPCSSGEECGSSHTEGSTDGKTVKWKLRSSACNPLDRTNAQQEKVRIVNSCCYTDDCDLYSPACEKTADILARTYTCTTKCTFLASVRLQQVQFRMGTFCYGNPNCTLSGTLPDEKSTLNGLVCPSCISTNSTWCYTDETIKCRGDEIMCLLMQTTQESGSKSASRAFRGCTTKSFCDFGSQSQNETGSYTEVKLNCKKASTIDSNSGSNSGGTIGSSSGSTNGSMNVHKVVLTPVIVCLLLLKLLF